MIVTAPSKCILFGEHAVVHHQKAICTTLGLLTRVKVTKGEGVRLVIAQMGIDTKVCLGNTTTKAFFGLVEELGVDGIVVTVTSDIPIGMGLGSSASFACCISAALLIHSGMDPDQLDYERINHHAYGMEKVFHGDSSGLDNTTICYGGSNVYTKRGGVTKIDTPTVKMFLVDTRIEKNTKRQVELYRQKMDDYPAVMDGINNAIGAISEQFVSECNFRDSYSFNDKLDGLIRLNQGLLQAAGMSTPKIDLFISRLSEIGVAAKITGAGGGGCVLVNLGHGQFDAQVEQLAKEMGMVVYKVEMGVPGVSVIND